VSKTVGAILNFITKAPETIWIKISHHYYELVFREITNLIFGVAIISPSYYEVEFEFTE